MSSIFDTILKILDGNSSYQEVVTKIAYICFLRKALN